MDVGLPFKVEYAKSGRASCKFCRRNIVNGSLRIAIMVQSAYFDGTTPNWFHEDCFFVKKRPKSTGDFGNIENIRWEDQQRIEKRIGSSTVGSAKAGKKSSKDKDSDVEYVKTIKPDGAPATKTGKKRAKEKNKASQDSDVEYIKTIKLDEPPATKKAKIEEEEKLATLLRDQSHRLFRFRDCCQSEMKKSDVIKLLEFNDQIPYTRDSVKLYDQLADMLTFGAIQACPDCGGTQMLFQKSGYICNSYQTEWTKCMKLTKEPPRETCKISKTFKKKYGFLKDVRANTEVRAIRYVPPSGATTSTSVPFRAQANYAKSSSIYTKSATLQLRNGLAVDPESGLEDIAQVYVSGKDKYNAVLGLTDIQRNKNSYYKLQLLVNKSQKKFWIFRSWGRIGTAIGGNKTDTYGTIEEAKQVFKALYLDKTANDFDDRNNFVKQPGRMYPIDVQYTPDEEANAALKNAHIKSKLHTAVHSLVELLFDVEMMKRTMLEFQLDLKKMPLGKLSKKQIQLAYGVLNEVYELTQIEGSKSAFIDATNRFYTLIPHNFGFKTPPLLDNATKIEDLLKMLDSLMEIECAFGLLNTDDDNQEEINPLDKHYAKLKTTLEPLDRKSEEFTMLQKYVQNTHAETHRMYDLEIVDIFKVCREGEARGFERYKQLHNRKLLWHGSRLTNFAGILSHGLRIAPPEAPVSGYMFGKGIYFADMVSKSANYCCTSKENSTGLLLLAEVPLGNMFECKSGTYVNELPKGKQSCFGRGRTMPDPKASVIREDGVEIPLGKPMTDEKLQSSLLYNEYIVYNTAQVNIQYLFRMEFKYKN